MDGGWGVANSTGATLPGRSVHSLADMQYHIPPLLSLAISRLAILFHHGLSFPVSANFARFDLFLAFLLGAEFFFLLRSRKIKYYCKPLSGETEVRIGVDHLVSRLGNPSIFRVLYSYGTLPGTTVLERHGVGL